MMADCPGYYSPPETKVNELLGRLLGQSWEDAFKIGTSEEPEPGHSADAVFLEDEDDDWA